MLFKNLWKKFKSTVRCKICKGWGGEWGLSQDVGPMCVDCWRKGGKL